MLFVKQNPEEEIVQESNDSKYIVIPLVMQLLFIPILYLHSAKAMMNYLYALIPLLLLTSLIGTYIYNRSADMKLFCCFAMLTTVGTALQIWIDQAYHPQSTFNLIKYLISFGIGFSFLIFYRLIRKLLNYTPTLYLMIVFSIAIYGVLLVAGADPNGYGTSAWLKVGSYTIQLTDLSKVAALLFYSSLFSTESGKDEKQILILSNLFFCIHVIGSILIKELGSLFILYFLHLSILYIYMPKGQKKRKYLLFVFFASVSVVAGIFLLWRLILPARNAGTMNSFETAIWPILNKIHTRFSITANINSDPYGAGYQLLQGKKAMWMAGLFGNTVNFTSIPVAESDMAFVALVNSFGWLLGLIAIWLFIRIFISGSELARSLIKKEKMDSVVVYGMTVLLCMQAAIVILGSCNLIPFTGLPIPFLSRGGTYSALTFSFAGVLLHLSIQEQDEQTQLQTMTESEDAHEVDEQ